MPKRSAVDDLSPLPGKIRRLDTIRSAGHEPVAEGQDGPSNGPDATSLVSSLTEEQLEQLLESPILTPTDGSPTRGGFEGSRLPSLHDRQLLQTGQPRTHAFEISAHDLPSSQGSDDEMPYDPPQGGRPAMTSDRLATRRSQPMLDSLRELPRDVQEEYLGPNFDFATDSLEPYENGYGVDFFSRSSHVGEDIPNIVVQLHPDLLIDASKFKRFVDYLDKAGQAPGFSAFAWKRHALIEAPPYKSNSAAGGFCKHQEASLGAELGQYRLADPERSLVWSRYSNAKLVDSRRYITFKQMYRLIESERKERKRNSENPFEKGPVAQHFDYLKSASNIDRREFGVLESYNRENASRASNPEIIARKGQHIFISGRLVRQERELLKAHLFELHSESQIQLMGHFPKTGDPTGAYQSLYTHGKPRFEFPNAIQTQQLGLRKDFQYKKEADFTEQYMHRDHFLDGMRILPGVNTALEKNNSMMFRKVDFQALHNSDYHKSRVAVSLLEDESPIDLERCNKIRALLQLDNNLCYQQPRPERSRQSDAGR